MQPTTSLTMRPTAVTLAMTSPTARDTAVCRARTMTTLTATPPRTTATEVMAWRPHPLITWQLLPLSLITSPFILLAQPQWRGHPYWWV